MRKLMCAVVLATTTSVAFGSDDIQSKGFYGSELQNQKVARYAEIAESSNFCDSAPAHSPVVTQGQVFEKLQSKIEVIDRKILDRVINSYRDITSDDCRHMMI